MKKFYLFLYTITIIFSFILIFYIFDFDSKNYINHYFPTFGLNEWTDYTLESQNGKSIIKGNIQISDTGNSFAFYTSHTNAEVYCNDKLIYQYPVINTNPFAKTSGYTWNFMSLPYENNKIEIILTSPYDGYAENIPSFLLGDTTSIIGKIILNEIAPFIICILIFILGLCMTLYWVYLRSKMPIKSNLLFLGIFALLLSLWSINELSFTVLLMKNNIACSYLSFIFLALLPLPFAQFVRSYYQDDNKIWDVFCTVNIIQVILCINLQLLKKCDLRNSLWTTHVIIVTLIFIVVARSYARIKKGNNSALVKTHLFCIIVCTVTLATDLILYYTKVMDGNVFGRLGFFLYIIILGFSASKESTKLIQLGKKADTYKKLAFTDQITNLYNRTAFNTDLEELSLEPKDICIINFDLNNLKRINDTKGHAFGDLYITSASKIISDTFSKYAKCYRVGGDEFVVIIKQASHSDIKVLIKIMEEKIKDYNNSQSDFDLQIAYGYAFYDSEIDKNLDNTSSRADRYMYQNKVRKKHGL